MKGEWVYCNAELVEDWVGSYSAYCPKCGSASGLVNALGGCATRIESKPKPRLSKFHQRLNEYKK